MVLCGPKPSSLPVTRVCAALPTLAVSPLFHDAGLRHGNVLAWGVSVSVTQAGACSPQVFGPLSCALGIARRHPPVFSLEPGG